MTSIGRQHKILVVATRDNMLNFYDISDGSLIKSYERPTDGAVGELEFSPNGKLLAVSDFAGNFQLWNTETDEILLDLNHLDHNFRLAWKPDGTQLLSYGQNGAFLWTFDADFLAQLED